MGHGVGKLYSLVVTDGSGGSVSVNLNRTYARVFVDLPLPGAAVNVQASTDGSTYKALAYPTGLAISAVVSLLSGYSGQIREIPGGLQYYKFINTVATGAGEAIRVWCTDL